MKPWIKLHRRISAKLQKCHPYTRAIAWEILRHADDDGRIPLEGETPVACLSRLLGSDRRMRNALPGDLAELERIGMLVQVGDDLVFASFEHHQDGVRKGAQERPQSVVNTTSVERQSSVSPTSVEPQSDVSRASVEPQHGPNSAESFNSGPGDKIREEEKREREESRARPSTTKGLSLVKPHNYGDGVRLKEFIRDGVAKAYEKLGDPAPDEARDMLWEGWARLERWVVEKARLVGRDERETARHLVRCFMRSRRARELGYPIGYLVQNAREYWRDTLPPEVAA